MAHRRRGIEGAMFLSVITPTYKEDSMSLGTHEPHLYSLWLLVTEAMGAPVFLHSGRRKCINSYGAMRAVGGFLKLNRLVWIRALTWRCTQKRADAKLVDFTTNLAWRYAVYCCCCTPTIPSPTVGTVYSDRNLTWQEHSGQEEPSSSTIQAQQDCSFRADQRSIIDLSIDRAVLLYLIFIASVIEVMDE